MMMVAKSSLYSNSISSYGMSFSFFQLLSQILFSNLHHAYKLHISLHYTPGDSRTATRASCEFNLSLALHRLWSCWLAADCLQVCPLVFPSASSDRHWASSRERKRYVQYPDRDVAAAQFARLFG